MHARYRKKATECNPALGGLIFFVFCGGRKNKFKYLLSTT
nr:MAG TPA: hypothetical protein [Caudoviricetes sp.]